MRLLKLFLVTAILFSQVAFSSSAQARSVLKQISRTGLTQEDINVMTEAAQPLYTSGKAKVGDDTIWSNEETGAFGMVEVVAVAGNCVQLNYKFQSRKQPKIQSLVLKRCQIDGRWVPSE